MDNAHTIIYIIERLLESKNDKVNAKIFPLKIISWISKERLAEHNSRKTILKKWIHIIGGFIVLIIQLV